MYTIKEVWKELVLFDVAGRRFMPWRLLGRLRKVQIRRVVEVEYGLEEMGGYWMESSGRMTIEGEDFLGLSFAYKTFKRGKTSSHYSLRASLVPSGKRLCE